MADNALNQLLDQLDADTLALARLASEGSWEAFARYQRQRDQRLQALDTTVAAALRAGSHSEAQVRERLLNLRQQNEALARLADHTKETLERQRAELERKTQAVNAYRGADKS